jgi:hypothetical protein
MNRPTPQNIATMVRTSVSVSLPDRREKAWTSAVIGDLQNSTSVEADALSHHTVSGGFHPPTKWFQECFIRLWRRPQDDDFVADHTTAHFDLKICLGKTLHQKGNARLPI